MPVMGQRQIAGTVMAGNEPAFAANVYMLNDRSNGTTVGMDGHFAISVSDNDVTDTLVVSYVGYHPYRKAVQDIHSLLNVCLEEENNLLKSVVISAASPLSEEFALAKLDKADIYMYPSSCADPLKAIKILPYSTNTGESANPELRGSDAGLSRVVLNEVPILNPVRNEQLNNLGMFSLFNTELIKEQTVYPGNPPLEYGDAVAGLVNIRTIDQVPENSKVNVSLSLASAGVMYQQPLNSNTFVQAYMNYQFSDLYKKINSLSARDIHNFYSVDFGANFHSQIGPKWFFNEYAYVIDEMYFSDYGEYNYFGRQKSHKTRNFYVTNLEYHNGPLALSFNDGVDYAFTRYNYGNIDEKNHSFRLFNSVFAKYNMSKIYIKGGIDDQFSRYSYNGFYPDVIAADLPYAGNAHFREQREHQHSLEAFLYTKINLEKIKIGAGVRKNMPFRSQPDFLSWQATVRYNPVRKQSLIFSTGRYNGYSVPEYAMREMSHISSKQISLDWLTHINKASLTFSGYLKEEKTPQFLFKDNISKYVVTDIKGLETSAELPLKHFNFRFSATMLDVKYKDEENDEKYRGTNDMKYILKCSIDYLNDRLFNASISFTQRPGLFYTPLTGASSYGDKYWPLYGEYNSAQYRSYSSLDFSVNRFFQLSKFGVVVFASMTNILNRKNENYYYYDLTYKDRKTKYFQRMVSYLGFLIEL